MGASTGHRGRVEARGHRSGWAPGLTRTSDRGAGVPSRDGRSAAPAALRGLTCSPASVARVARWWSWIARAGGRVAHMPSRAAPKASCLVEHEKERRQLGPKFASSPEPCQSDGRGLRRGLDGPSMPPLLKKNGDVFLHPPKRPRGRVGRGLFRRRLRHVVGHPRHVYEGAGRDRPTLRGRASSNAQGNRGRSGPISDGRTPEKQAPVHPVATKAAASAKREPRPTTIHSGRRRHGGGCVPPQPARSPHETHRNPIDNHGTAAMMIVPTSSASMYLIIGRIPRSGFTRAMAQAE